MLDINAIENFHFLRPLWFLLLFPIAFLHWQFRQQYQQAGRWKKAIAPHLLEHLFVNEGAANKLRPYQLLGALLLVGMCAAAGPSWNREVTPFTEDKAPLIIALELSSSMMAVDQAPSRLERAKQKIHDLLAVRQGARTALITYAGSAHVALPLTDDAELINIYLESLVPSLMPVKGDNPGAALTLAQTVLASEGSSGTVLFMSDGIDRTLATNFSEFSESNNDQILIMGFGTEQGGFLKAEDNTITNTAGAGTDWLGLTAIANAAGGSLLRSSLDDEDISTLSRIITRNLVNALNEDEDLRWHDSGYYLSWLLLLLALFWFRKGWVVL